MKLPKNYFENLSAAKYREYLKLLPKAEQETIKYFITFMLTFGALIFFGIFAINPTLSTIVDLKKQLKDNEYVTAELEKKIANISTLQQKYTDLTPQLPVIYDAIPQSPSVFLFSAQVQSLAKKSNVSLKAFQVFEVQLAGRKQLPSQNPSFGYSLEITGDYDKMLGFASALARMNRITTVETIAINKDSKTKELNLAIQGKTYFKQ